VVKKLSRTSKHRNAISNYPSLRTIHSYTTTYPPYNPILEIKPNESNQLSQQNTFLEQLRIEWRQNNLSTDSLERIQGFMNVLVSEVGKARAKKLMRGFLNFIKKIPFKEVMNAMSKDKNLGNLLNELLENGKGSDMLQKMMDNPELKKNAMDMMQEMMSDEKKMAEMTEMMSKMLNPDNK
jgi:hypothetical protein